jgi:hypothetical protein
MNENETINKYKDFVSISTIADGSCLIHSVLKAYHTEYQENNSISFRQNQSDEYRRKLAESLLQPDKLYPTIEDMSNLVRSEYNTEKPKRFTEFLRTMYGYNNVLFEYPNDMIVFVSDGKCYDIEVYRAYIRDYTEYLNEYTKRFTNKKDNTIKTPLPATPRITYNLDHTLSNEDLENINILNDYTSKLIEHINAYIIYTKNILEQIMGCNLYLPNNFGIGVIEKILESVEIVNDKVSIKSGTILPMGKYYYMPYNCILFTASKASPLIKFELEHLDIPGIVTLGDVSKHLNSRKFIGDADCLVYIPYLLSVNLIIVNLESNSVIAIYDNYQNDNYIIINSIKEVHFETVAILEDNSYKTLFNRKDNIIKFIVKNKSLNLVEEKSLDTKLKDTFGDKIDITVKDSKLFVKYYQSSKTTYRFYLNSSGELISGIIPQSLKNKISEL